MQQEQVKEKDGKIKRRDRVYGITVIHRMCSQAVCTHTTRRES